MEPYIRSWESHRGLGALYGVVEVSSGPPKEVAATVWEGIEQGLQGASLTRTGYLRRALETAHRILQDYAAREWRAGVSLLSLRDGDLYIAQAGPILCCLLEDSRLLRPTEASEEVMGGGVSLGDPDGPLIPHVVHPPLHDGSLLLIAWTGLSRVAPPEALVPILSGGIESASQGIYRLARDERDFSLLLLDFKTDQTEPAG